MGNEMSNYLLHSSLDDIKVIIHVFISIQHIYAKRNGIIDGIPNDVLQLGQGTWIIVTLWYFTLWKISSNQPLKKYILFFSCFF